jgi:hypothetical protein
MCSDTPDDTDDFLRRERAAVACIASLAPANADEADLAAQFVAASDEGMDWLRRVRLPETTPEMASKYRTRAIRAMRQSKSALRRLLRMQEARRKQEADTARAASVPARRGQ